MSRDDIKALLHQLVDVVVQCGIEGRERVVKEIWRRDAAADVNAEVATSGGV